MSRPLHMIAKAGRLPALAAALFMAVGPQMLQAQTDPEPTEKTEGKKGKFGIEYKLDFRPEKPRFQKDMSKARPILDQMIANKGPDNLLRDFGWKKFEADAARATAWIKACKKTPFDFLMAGMKATNKKIDKRAQAIQKIHDGIEKVYKEKKKRWDTVVAGDEALMHVLKGFLAKFGGIQVNKLFEWIAEGLEAKNMPGGSKVASGAGKALGAIGTAIAIYQFFAASDEYFEMQSLSSQMLEMLEAMAYLKVLLRQYDDLLVSQDALLADIDTAFLAHKCQKCSGD